LRELGWKEPVCYQVASTNTAERFLRKRKLDGGRQPRGQAAYDPCRRPVFFLKTVSETAESFSGRFLLRTPPEAPEEPYRKRARSCARKEPPASASLSSPSLAGENDRGELGIMARHSESRSARSWSMYSLISRTEFSSDLFSLRAEPVVELEKINWLASQKEGLRDEGEPDRCGYKTGFQSPSRDVALALEKQLNMFRRRGMRAAAGAGRSG